MSCEELEDSYELYVLGAVEGDVQAEIQEHIGRACIDCNAALKRAFAFTALWASTTPPASPPARLRRRILASIGVSPERAWLWVAVTAAACCLLAVAFLGVRGNLQKTELAEARKTVNSLNAILVQPETKVVTFGAGQPQPPHGRVLVNPKSGVLLMASNLPPAVAGRIYELWIIPKGGAPIPSGLFQASAAGTALYLRPGALDVASTGAVAVTLEPAGGSLAPTSKPLIVAAL